MVVQHRASSSAERQGVPGDLVDHCFDAGTAVHASFTLATDIEVDLTHPHSAKETRHRRDHRRGPRESMARFRGAHVLLAMGAFRN